MGDPRRSGDKRSDQAYERIRELILAGALAPGTRIVETDLAERLGMSRTPVRSALQRLMQDGFILGSSKGRKLRLVVSPLTKDDAREVYHIVAVLDGLAARTAAGLPEETRREVAADMRAANEELRRASQAEVADPAQLMDLHAALHGRYLDAINAPRLLALFANIRPQADRYRRIYSTGNSGSRLTRSAEEHERMINAIEAGDRVEAQRATEENWMAAAERLCRVINVVGEHGRW